MHPRSERTRAAAPLALATLFFAGCRATGAGSAGALRVVPRAADASASATQDGASAQDDGGTQDGAPVTQGATSEAQDAGDATGAAEAPVTQAEGAEIEPTSDDTADADAFGDEAFGDDALGSDATPEQLPRAEDGSRELRGSLALRLRSRWSGDAHDHDLFGVVTADYADPARERTAYSVMARVSADLDGRDDDDGLALGSLEDTYDSAVQARLYHAHATVPGIGPFELVRVGRQWIHETPELAWLDGVLVQTSELGRRRTRGAVYGGVPVHFYESSPAGDAIAGAWLESRPWKSARARLDWMYVEDAVRLGQHVNDVLGIGLWQELAAGLTAELKHSRVDGDARDVRAAASWLDAEHDLAVRVEYYRLLETQRELALELDPFSAPLHELFPFHEARLSVSKDFGESLQALMGYGARRVEELEDVGEHNRDYDRGFLTLAFPELLPEDVVLAVTGDWWDASGSDVTSFGAELSRAWDGGTEAALGSYYSLYKYDWDGERERDHVRTWFARVGFAQGERLRHEIRYEYDDDAFDDVQSLRWVSTWRF